MPVNSPATMVQHVSCDNDVKRGPHGSMWWGMFKLRLKEQLKLRVCYKRVYTNVCSLIIKNKQMLASQDNRLLWQIRKCFAVLVILRGNPYGRQYWVVIIPGSGSRDLQRRRRNNCRRSHGVECLVPVTSYWCLQLWDDATQVFFA